MAGNYRRRMAPLGIALGCMSASLFAQEKKDAPRIIAISPIQASPGEQVKLKLRGLNLAAATEVKFPALPALQGELKEKKKADLPAGSEAKEVGDTQCEVHVTLPADLPLGILAVVIVTPAGTTEPREIAIIGAGSLAEEKEPNDGFAEAQAIELGKGVRGRVKEARDVDVYSFTVSAPRSVAIEVVAARRASLLDPLITLYDEQQRILRTVDDTAANRDPVMTFQLPVAGKYYLALQDAGDRGGEWHPYELHVKEQP